MQSPNGSTGNSDYNFRKRTVEATPRPGIHANGVKQEKRKTVGFANFVGSSILIIIAFPVGVIVLNEYCSEKRCEVWSFPTISLDYKDYFTRDGLLYYFLFFVFQLVLSLLPIGRIFHGDPLQSTGERLSYRLNGRFSLLANTLFISSIVYFKVPLAPIYDSFRTMMATGIVLSFICSALLYVKGQRAPEEHKTIANTGMAGFFMGSELHPRIGPLELKMYLSQVMMLGIVYWHLLIVALCFEKGIYPDTGLVLLTIAKTIPGIKHLLYQGEYVTSFAIQKEGVGFIHVFSYFVLVPFLYVMPARFLYHHPQQLPIWQYVIFTCIFSAGFYIWHSANRQKHLFKTAPDHQPLTGVETIPVKGSNKGLLVSGWYGMSRHPNTFGQLTLYLGSTFCCGFSSPFPYIVLGIMSTFIILKTIHQEAHLGQKYGEAWTAYKKRAKNMLILNIF